MDPDTTVAVCGSTGEILTGLVNSCLSHAASRKSFIKMFNHLFVGEHYRRRAIQYINSVQHAENTSEPGFDTPAGHWDWHREMMTCR